MRVPRLILLPGMHGTDEMFGPLLACVAEEYRPLVVEYPRDQVLGYDALLELIEQKLAGEDAMVLLGESFSGPLAIRFAAKHRDRVRGVILCVTFARFPISRVLVSFTKMLLRVGISPWAVRSVLMGWRSSAEVDSMIRRVMEGVDRNVLTARIEEVAGVDVREELARCDMPMLYLRATKDRVVRAKRCREILELCPQMIVKKFVASHLLLQTVPGEAWEVIEGFIRSALDESS
jgi:pimeloyl-[acyl-carrier protein] methyl ester esterase